MPGELVRLRISPFSAGTVRISPRAPNTARKPVGEMSELEILFATFKKRVRKCGSSPEMRISTLCAVPDFKS